MRSREIRKKNAAGRRSSISRTIFQLGYELNFALFLMALGLSVHGASTAKMVDPNGFSQKDKLATIVTIRASRRGVQVEMQGLNRPVRSLAEAEGMVHKASSAAPSKSFKVILAPGADATFSEVSTWYRSLKDNLPSGMTVSVAIQ